MKLISTILSSISLVALAKVTATPDSEPLMICQMSGPTKDRNDCILNGINSLWSKIKAGSLRDFHITDPFIVKNANFYLKQGSNSLRLNIRNATISGISESRVTVVHSKFIDDKFYLVSTVYSPKLDIQIEYKAIGCVNNFKLNAAGHASVKIYNMTVALKFYNEIVTFNNEEYMISKAFEIGDSDIREVKIKANGIFPDPELNAFVVEFMNKYWHSTYRLLLSYTKSSYEPLVIEEINKFLGRVPLRRLFLK